MKVSVRTQCVGGVLWSVPIPPPICEKLKANASSSAILVLRTLFTFVCVIRTEQGDGWKAETSSRARGDKRKTKKERRRVRRCGCVDSKFDPDDINI